MSPVLFLDIDGVLNSEAWFARQRGRGLSIISNRAEMIDPGAVVQLNRVVGATGARVVLSSSWRLHAELSQVQGWLEQAGFRGQLAGATPRLGGGRGREVSRWLDAQAPRPEVYALVDDEPEPETHPGRWVATRYAAGLTATEADQLIALLGQASFFERGASTHTTSAAAPSLFTCETLAGAMAAARALGPPPPRVELYAAPEAGKGRAAVLVNGKPAGVLTAEQVEDLLRAVPAGVTGG